MQFLVDLSFKKIASMKCVIRNITNTVWKLFKCGVLRCFVYFVFSHTLSQNATPYKLSRKNCLNNFRISFTFCYIWEIQHEHFKRKIMENSISLKKNFTIQNYYSLQWSVRENAAPVTNIFVNHIPCWNFHSPLLLSL